MPSYVNHTIALQDASSFTLTRPTYVAGDMMLLIFLEDPAGSPVITGGSTWGAMSAGTTIKYAWKLTGASEPSTYSVTGANTTFDGGIYWLGSFRDPANASPIMTVGGRNSASQVRAPGFTPSGLFDIDIRVAYGTTPSSGNLMSSWSTPSGYTAVGYARGPEEINMSVFYKQLNSTAFSPEVTMDNSFDFLQSGARTIQLTSPVSGWTGWGSAM